MQPCLIFHPDVKYKEKYYNLQEAKHDEKDFEKAMKKAEEFDYSELKAETKIPIGIFYKKEEKTFEEKYWQLQNLIKNKKSWKDVKR